jgi:hypothetical protein
MMSEEALQRAVAQLLDRLGLLWCHVPNESKRSKAQGGRLKAQGMKRGVPDVLIFEEWQRGAECDVVSCQCLGLRSGNNVAIELKVPGKYPTQDQKAWLASLTERDFLTAVCRDMDEVIAVLKHVRPRNGRRIQ